MSRAQAIFVFLAMTRVAVNAKQLACSKQRIFIATQEHILYGHVIATHQVNSFQDCHMLCLEHPKCLSFNYQATSISSSHVCEINDATAEMCPLDMIRKAGYKYYEDKDATSDGECPRRDFQLNFLEKNVTNYVRFDLQRRTPPLTAFTVCLWLKTDDQADDGTSFSYSLPDQPNAILLTDYTSFRIIINNIYRDMDVALNDDQWHHICFTWENTAGSWNFYKDASRLDFGEDFQTGYVIENNGIFILGQDQDSYGGGFEQDQSFLGQMSNVNLWSSVLTEEEILHMAHDCSFGVGNYLRWSDFLTADFHGNVTKTPTSADCGPS